MIQPVVLGGVFIGVLSALPIVNLANCCCLWIMGGGILAVYLTQHQTHRAVLPGRGALLGVLAGIVGAVVWLVAYAIVDVIVGPLQQRMMASLLQGRVDLPPDVKHLLETVSAQAASPLRYVAGFVVQLVTGVIFGAVGGLLGAVFLTREAPPVPAPFEPPPIPE